MENLNLPEVIYTRYSNGTIQSNGIESWMDCGVKMDTRDEAITRLAQDLLPEFQANNIHHGMRAIQSGVVPTQPSMLLHYRNAVAMNTILDSITAGATHVQHDAALANADQIA